jgi:cytochrome c oxidase subunit III
MLLWATFFLIDQKKKRPKRPPGWEWWSSLERVQSRNYGWPPDPNLPTLPWQAPAVNTLALGLSSLMAFLGLRWLRAGKVNRLAPMWAGATAFGLIFLILQTKFWLHMWMDAGLSLPDGGVYASVFYGLTWIHGLHVLVGLFGLGWITFRAFRGDFSPAKFLSVRLWSMYWHFMGAIWALMFVTVFLV